MGGRQLGLKAVYLSAKYVMFRSDALLYTFIEGGTLDPCLRKTVLQL